MTIKTVKPKEISNPNKSDPVQEKAKQINLRYVKIKEDIESVLKQHRVEPIELMRIASELQVIAFENAFINTSRFIVDKIEKSKKGK